MPTSRARVSRSKSKPRAGSADSLGLWPVEALRHAEALAPGGAVPHLDTTETLLDELERLVDRLSASARPVGLAA